MTLPLNVGPGATLVLHHTQTVITDQLSPLGLGLGPPAGGGGGGGVPAVLQRLLDGGLGGPGLLRAARVAREPRAVAVPVPGAAEGTPHRGAEGAGPRLASFKCRK